jgi:hypothetical protein
MRSQWQDAKERDDKRNGWKGNGGKRAVPVIPINPRAVTRCALSAHTRPLIMNLSKPETFASLARAAASLNRRTFCCGVSPAGPGVRCGKELVGFDAVLGVGVGGFAEACGVVDVKRVASMADFGIVSDANSEDWEGTKDCDVGSYI